MIIGEDNAGSHYVNSSIPGITYLGVMLRPGSVWDCGGQIGMDRRHCVCTESKVISMEKTQD